MPSTINGIGTKYHGRANFSSRRGTCQRCKRETTLSSYDTRLWFCFVFITIIPLGRKRIIDYCSGCSGHYVMELSKWTAARQLELSGARSKFAEMQTPENAFALHQQLLNFHEFVEANEIRRQILTLFPHNALLFVQLAESLQPYFLQREIQFLNQRAYEIDPSMPLARMGVAREKIEKNSLMEARELVEFLMVPGSSQSYNLGILISLAEAFQRNNQSGHALAVCQFLLTELPHLDKNVAFRNLVRSAEKQAIPGSLPNASLLGKIKPSWTHFFGLKGNPSWPRFAQPALAVSWLLVAGGLVLFFIDLGQMKTTALYVVREQKSATAFELDGKQVSLPSTLTKLSLPEGAHKAKFKSGAPVSFEIRSEFWRRIFGGDVWVLTESPAVILEEEHAHYSKNNPSPSQFTFYYGRQFYRLMGITHPFELLPKTVEVRNSYQEETRSSLTAAQEPLSYIFQHLASTSWPAALAFAELELNAKPEEEDLLGAYEEQCLQREQTERAYNFIASRIDKLELIEWHRLYQELSKLQKKDNSALLARYEKLLELHPGKSVYLYLLARVTKDQALAKELFERAAKADQSNPYPHYALCYHALADGDFETAYQQGLMMSGQPKFEDIVWETLKATGRVKELERRARGKLGSNPMDFSSALALEEALIQQHDTNSADAQMRISLKTLNERLGAGANPYTEGLRNQVSYFKGEIAELRYRLKGSKDPYFFFALIESSLPDDAEQFLKKNPMDGFNKLILSMAFRKAGNQGMAAKWEQSSLEDLKKLYGGDSEMAGFLTRSDPPTLAELSSRAQSITEKRILLGALCLKHPGQKGIYAPLLNKLNCSLTFPHYFLAGIAAEK